MNLLTGVDVVGGEVGVVGLAVVVVVVVGVGVVSGTI